MRKMLEDLCRKLGVRVGAVRTMAMNAGLPTDDSSLYYMLKWHKESRG